MTIILGCFNYPSFDKLKSNHNAQAYDKWCCTFTSEEYMAMRDALVIPFDNGIVEEVAVAAHKNEKILFDVTHLYFPFDKEVTTLLELCLIMYNDVLFNKTQFYVNGKEVNKDKLKSLFFKDESVKLIELQELFI